MFKWIVVMKIQLSICLDDGGKPRNKPQSGWSAPGFEPGTPRMRVSCVTTEPPRSVSLLLFLHFRRKTRHKMGIGVCVSVCKILVSPNNFHTNYPIDTKFWLHTVSY